MLLTLIFSLIAAFDLILWKVLGKLIFGIIGGLMFLNGLILLLLAAIAMIL